MWLFTFLSFCLFNSLHVLLASPLHLNFLLLLPLSARKSCVYHLPSYWPVSFLLNQPQQYIFTQCINIPQHLWVFHSLPFKRFFFFNWNSDLNISFFVFLKHFVFGRNLPLPPHTYVPCKPDMLFPPLLKLFLIGKHIWDYSLPPDPPHHLFFLSVSL